MKKINIQNLKRIFSGKEAHEVEVPVEVEEEELSPYLKYVLAIRGVSQMELIDEIWMNRSPQEYGAVRQRVLMKQFDFLYEVLMEVPLEESKDLVDFVLKDVGKKEAVTNLNKIINHFAELEEYEKCADVQKYLHKIEKS